MKFRGVISLRKLLPIWAMPKGIRTRVLSRTFLKLTKMPWAVSGRRKAASSSPPRAPTIVLNMRLNSRGAVSVPSVLASGPSTAANSAGGTVVSETQRALPGQLVGVLGAEVEELEGLLLGLLEPLLAARLGGHEHPLPLGLDPAALHLVEAVAAFRLAAVDHVVVEEVVMARTLPDLRVHDDRAVQAGHFKGRGGAGRRVQFVMGGDHVVPPGLADVPLQFDPQGAVVPEALQSAVDFAGLKEKSPPPAQGDQLFHFHSEGLGKE